MNRVQLACCALLASALVLAGLLVHHIDRRLPAAAADPMVVSRENFTVMTARTRANEEAFFLLDNTSQRLLVYRVDLARGRFVLAGTYDVARAFGNPR